MSTDPTTPTTDARSVLLAEYLDAFRKANPSSAAPRLKWERGWFVERKLGHLYARYREKTLADMRDRLLARLAEEVQ